MDRAQTPAAVRLYNQLGLHHHVRLNFNTLSLSCAISTVHVQSTRCKYPHTAYISSCLYSLCTSLIAFIFSIFLYFILWSITCYLLLVDDLLTLATVNTVNVPIVTLIKDYLILSYLILSAKHGGQMKGKDVCYTRTTPAAGALWNSCTVVLLRVAVSSCSNWLRFNHGSAVELLLPVLCFTHGLPWKWL